MRARVGGVNTTSLIGDAFRKAKYEIVAAKKEATKARAGKKLVLSVVERIPSPTPFLFARPRFPIPIFPSPPNFVPTELARRR
ncbi:hypothetical protein COY44_00355 [Candidatus Berkelbacteria bacterium CG_4_10_14_0_8_um_filter_39_42]|nr:MAG: hypothetical protein COY44_00355 [Candidatus Berkelbacteria bacterium CG_4_10_14_0_8_um_filter_39_42]